MSNTAQGIAESLYRRHVTNAGHDHPRTLDDLVDIIIASGATVVFCSRMPYDFPGAYCDNVVMVNGSFAPPRQFEILAHELAHFYRASAIHDEPGRMRLYPSRPDTAMDGEDRIAKAFEDIITRNRPPPR